MLRKLSVGLTALAIVALVMNSCASKEPEPVAPKAEVKQVPKSKNIIALDDLASDYALTEAQTKRNQEIIDGFKKKQVIIAKTDAEDIKVKEVLQAKKSVIEAEKKAFEELVEKKVKDEKIKELIAKAQTTGDLEQLEKILRESTDLTETEIKELVKKKAELIKKDTALRKSALQKIHERLVRNRNLGIEERFCATATSLDHLVINPIFYDVDVYAIKKDAADKLYVNIEKIIDQLDEYSDLVLQLEGNCDERGSNIYNKNLGDYRWTGVVPLLTSMQIDKSSIRGISKGEECALDRSNTDTNESWWQKNRRTDFKWTLK